MEYYWELIKKDGTRYQIPPSAVPTVQRRMEKHDPINLKTASIPYSEIKDFQITSKVYVDPDKQALLPDVSYVFNEPLYNDDGSVVSKWVKTPVTQSKYEKFYAPSGYRKLAESGGMVMVAFRLPLHQINPETMTVCTETESQEMEKRRK